MKAQFKYAFRAGFNVRGAVFCVIFVMNLVFLALGALNLLPFAAKVTAVSLGGVAITVMMVVNIVGDVAVASRMFSAPGAYLHALTPAPRRQILLASVVTMAAMDFVSMAFAIFSEVLLSFNLIGDGALYAELAGAIASPSVALNVLMTTALAIAGYLMVMMVILFCVTARKSILSGVRGGGLLTAALAVGVVYAITLSALLLAPFGSVSRFGLFFTISLGGAGVVMYALLTFLQAAALYVLTSKLMERKLNI